MEMPLIGLGSSRISNIVEVVSNSIKDGLRLIDIAFYYKNEEEVGKGIKVALDNGYCKREDLFVIGKLWIEHKDDPEKAIKDTLQKLGLDYLDMYLDHWPSGNNYTKEGVVKRVSVFESWPKMEALVDKQLTKSIGCSNYNVQSLFNLLSFCRIKPVANEIERDVACESQDRNWAHERGCRSSCKKGCGVSGNQRGDRGEWGRHIRPGGIGHGYIGLCRTVSAV